MSTITPNSALAVLPSTDSKPTLRFLWAQAPAPGNDILLLTNDGKWRPTVLNLTAPLKLKPEDAPSANTPLAAACTKDMQQIRVYYATTGNTLAMISWNTDTSKKAFNAAEDESRKIWTFASLFTVDQKRKRNPITVPKGSDLAAFTVGTPAGWRFLVQGTKGSLRIMENLQPPNTVGLVTSYEDQPTMPPGFERTRISALSWLDGSNNFEGYFQDKDGQLVSVAYEREKTDDDGDEFPDVPQRLFVKTTSITSVNKQSSIFGVASVRFALKDGKFLHRLYVVTPVSSSHMVVEYEKDSKTGNWTKLPSVIGPVLAGTRLAAQGWSTATGPELSLFCQDGVVGSKVTEWTKSDSGAWVSAARIP